MKKLKLRVSYNNNNNIIAFIDEKPKKGDPYIKTNNFENLYHASNEDKHYETINCNKVIASTMTDVGLKLCVLINENLILNKKLIIDLLYNYNQFDVELPYITYDNKIILIF